MKSFSEKCLKAAESLPDFAYSVPGFPDFPPFMPYRIQFYYRRRNRDTNTFFHNRYILACLLAGNARLEINKRLCSLKPLQLYLVFPGESHRILSGQDEGSSMLFCSFHLHDEQKAMDVLRGTILESDAGIRRLLLCALRDFLIHYPEGNREINTTPYLLGELLERLRVKNCPAPPETFRKTNYSDEGSELYRKISRYIVENPHRKITIAELSRRLGVSASNLRRCFKRQIGKSLGKYLRSRRMMFAAGLLRSSGQNISQIAALCGYRSAAAFSRAFKREETRYSPSEFRKKIRAPLS